MSPPVMTVYDGATRIGEIEDHGRGNILAFALTPDGRVELGVFLDRATAIKAVPLPTRGRP